MIKMYLQLLTTLGSFFGFMACLSWFVLTYIYSSQISARGGVLNVDWNRLVLVGILLALCIVAFVGSVIWVRRSKREQREKMERYRKFSS